MFRLFLIEQLVKVLALEKFHGSEDGAEHIAPESHGVVDFIGIDNPQKDQVRMNLVYFTGYFAEDVPYDP